VAVEVVRPFQRLDDVPKKPNRGVCLVNVFAAGHLEFPILADLEVDERVVHKHNDG